VLWGQGKLRAGCFVENNPFPFTSTLDAKWRFIFFIIYNVHNQRKSTLKVEVLNTSGGSDDSGGQIKQLYIPIGRAVVQR
jgi:hypothetical protein